MTTLESSNRLGIRPVLVIYYVRLPNKLRVRLQEWYAILRSRLPDVISVWCRPMASKINGYGDRL